MEGYDQFREILTSHLDESSSKGKDKGLLGMDRDERTGLLIGSAVSALMGGVSGRNPLATGLAAYGQGADNIYNKRKQAIDMEQTQAKGELAKMNSYINLMNAQKKKTQTPQYLHPNKIMERISAIGKARLSVKANKGIDPIMALVAQGMDEEQRNLFVGAVNQGDIDGAISLLDREQQVLESQLPKQYRAQIPEASKAETPETSDAVGSFITTYGKPRQ